MSDLNFYGSDSYTPVEQKAAVDLLIATLRHIDEGDLKTARYLVASLAHELQIDLAAHELIRQANGVGEFYVCQ